MEAEEKQRLAVQQTQRRPFQRRASRAPTVRQGGQREMRAGEQVASVVSAETLGRGGVGW